MSRQSMSPVDAAWLHMGRSTNLMIVNGLLLLDVAIDYGRAKDTIRERLVEPFPRFRQRVVENPLGIGLPVWEDDANFNLDLHVHRRRLPAPGDTAALCQLAGELVVVPLDPAKPLWDMYLIEGYGSGTALLARMHHCIADGIAAARVVLSLTDEEPGTGPAAAAAIGPSRPRDRVGSGVVHLVEGALHEGLELLAHPASETRAALDGAAANARALAKLLLTGPDARTVLKEPPGVARRLLWCEPVPLEEIKAIGHATATTVNDVVLAALTGALGSYLKHRDSSVAEIRAVIPFNLRPLNQPLPRELGNCFGLVELALPIPVTDPRERLAEVHRRMQQIKQSPEAPLSYQILGLVGRVPPVVERRIVDLMSNVESIVITNVPGPSQPVYFAGAKVTGLLAWVPTGGGISIGVSVVSYDGAVTIALQTAANVVPDPERLISAFAREVRSLKRLRSGGPRRTRRRAQAG
jgi:diacylglycerol O-acyltransferase / wax synthase